MQIDKYKTEEYDGTMESLEKLAKNLLIKNTEDCHFNIFTKKIYIPCRGLILMPGDCYQYLLPQKKIEAIG